MSCAGAAASFSVWSSLLSGCLPGCDALRKPSASCFAIPFLVGLRRDLALDEELRELPALRLALEWHG
jgi:hypothetical protein